MERSIAIYVRVSSKKQDTKSQEPDLKRWVDAYADGQPATWHRDHATGRTMDRPGWRKLEADIAAGNVSKLVVWRLDRLGRTASGLTTLFETLRERKVGLVSLRDGLDLETPSGRLMAHILASVACYEIEIRGERVMAGQAVAKAAGKTWGGSQRGKRKTVTEEQMKVIRRLKAEGTSVASIARTVRLSRPTVYGVLDEAQAILRGS